MPDLLKMNEAARILFDYEDFTSFSRLGTDVKTNNCKVYEAKWTDEGNRLVFSIKADRFLRNMVRAVVGTLLEVGFGKLTVEDFRHIIELKDRGAAGASVPAKGLFLVDIGYPEELSSRIDQDEIGRKLNLFQRFSVSMFQIIKTGYIGRLRDNRIIQKSIHTQLIYSSVNTVPKTH